MLAFQKTQSLSAALVAVSLGWLFQQAVFPEGSFFSEEYVSKLEEPPADALDGCDLVDHALLYHCCPYLGEIRLLLVNFMMENQSQGTSIRKITPVTTEVSQKPQFTRRQLQLQLEENFFHNHPGSLRRTVDFVAERVASNYIKEFRASVLPDLLGRGLAVVHEKHTTVQVESTPKGRRAQEQLKQEIRQTAVSLAKEGQDHAKSKAAGFSEKNVEGIMEWILPKEISECVKVMAKRITSRLAKEKIIHWMEAHITSGVFLQQLTAEQQKLDKLQKLAAERDEASDKEETVASKNSKTVVKSEALPGAMGDSDTKSVPKYCQVHNDAAPRPWLILTQLKTILRKLTFGETTHLKTEDIISAISLVEQMLKGRQDVVSSIYRCLARLTTEISCQIMFCLPHLWMRQLQVRLLDLWMTYLKEKVNFNKLICDKNLYILSSSPDPKASWCHLTSLTLALIKNDLLQKEDAVAAANAAIENNQGSKKDLEEYLITLETSVCDAIDDDVTTQQNVSVPSNDLQNETAKIGGETAKKCDGNSPDAIPSMKQLDLASQDDTNCYKLSSIDVS